MSERILIRVGRPGNRRLIAAELGDGHEVVVARSDEAVEEPFDLAVVDEAALGRLAPALRARKTRERPVHLPILLIAGTDTLRRLPKHAVPAFDDVIVAPTERSVLRTRVDRLLLTRRLSEELLERAEEAERATRLRDEVLAIIAHDLRNPLGTIAGSAGLLQMPLSDEKRRHHIAMIQRTADRMNRLIQDLLDVAKIEAGRLELEPSRVDPAALVREAIEVERTRAGDKELTLDGDVPSHVPPIRADRDELLRVLTNLIGNAIKFTDPGGRVGVRAERFDDRVRFSVSDTGEGIPEHDLAHLFARFWQAERTQRAGAGLGLAIAKGIVEAHGGEIHAESQVDVGSTFHFTVPVANGA